MSVARLYLGLWALLTCVVLTCCAGVTQVSTREGEDAILPCATDTPVDLREKAFDWKKGKQEVFMYENGSHYKNGRRGQDPQFKDRAQHHQEWLKAGNASLILLNVTKGDSGVYECHILDPETLTRYVNLTVGNRHPLTGDHEEVSWNVTWTVICVIMGVIMLLFGAIRITQCCTKNNNGRVGYGQQAVPDSDSLDRSGAYLSRPHREAAVQLNIRSSG